MAQFVSREAFDCQRVMESSMGCRKEMRGEADVAGGWVDLLMVDGSGCYLGVMKFSPFWGE